jgi:hypothetical protein
MFIWRRVFFIAGKLVFKLASAVTLYSAVLLSLVTVGSVLTLIQRYTTFLSKINTFERAIEQTYMSLPFVFMAVGPFLYCTEIWKRIQFINSWGIFQVIFSFFYIYGNPRTKNLWVYIAWYLQSGREVTIITPDLTGRSLTPRIQKSRAPSCQGD